MKRSHPTQKSIAEAIGVSRETISHILNGRALHRYSDETRKKVLQAVKDFDYHPHKGAQIMSRGRSNLIGIVHFGMSYQVARKAAHYLPQLITENGYRVFIADLSWHGGLHSEAIEQLIDMRVEGVILLQRTESFGLKEIDILKRVGIPSVAMAGDEELGIPVVSADSIGAFKQMVQHLYHVGHRSMILLTNDYEKRPTRNRIAGFKRGVEQFPDVQSEVVQISAERHGFDTGEVSYMYTKKLLESNALPDVIVCTNDLWARGVFSACLEAGLKVPEDIAITGFDNDSYGAYAPYYLTTCAQDIASEATKTSELLMDLIAGKSLPQREYIYPCKMIIRRSCGATTSIPTNTTKIINKLQYNEK